jgi:tetrahydromethanopterin S-methyltransferase subunit F
VFNGRSEVAAQHAYRGGEVNRGIIGAIIGVLVIIILVIVILQMT